MGGIVEIIGAVSLIVTTLGSIFGLLGKKKAEQKLQTVSAYADVAVRAVDVVASAIKKTNAVDAATAVKDARTVDPEAGALIRERVAATGTNVK